jgi:hypothetical protein
MSEELTQDAVDAAIILENRVRERVQHEVKFVVKEMVRDEVSRLLSDAKGAMVMEVTTSINQMLRSFVEQERKPLWESTPEELGLTPADLNKHMLGKDIDENVVLRT